MSSYDGVMLPPRLCLGTVIPDSDRCATCKGKKTTKEKKTLEVFVERGMRHGQKVKFDGEADQSVRCVALVALVVVLSLIVLLYPLRVCSDAFSCFFFLQLNSAQLFLRTAALFSVFEGQESHAA